MTDMLLAIAFAALATLIAAGMIRVPVEFTSSLVVQALLLIAALSFFAYSPVVGIAAIALFAVIIFHRNVQKTVQYSTVPQYGDETIYSENVKTQPYMSVASQPTPYPPMNQVWGVEGFESAPYGAAELAVDGQYPLPATTATATGYSNTYMYQPDADQGSNEFQRFGPNMDQKLEPLAYD